jgi:hypothetical protein
VRGVQATDTELELQVLGFPDLHCKIFLIKQDAQVWFRLELASCGLNTPEPTDDVRESRDNNRDNNEPRGNERHNVADWNRHQESITGPARIHGEDSSKGEAEKTHGASIHTGEAVKLLSPPHSGTETMEDLMEAVPDVASRGELVNSASEANEQMANSLQALAKKNAQRTNVMMKDTQWKNKARSALSKVKSLETLIELHEEVDEQQLKVGESAKHAVAEIMRRACWPESPIEQHLETGGIARLIERSQLLWMQLPLHFQKLQKGTDQWESTAQLHVEHFTKQSLVTRKCAPTRSVVVQEVCCFLRDEAVNRFVSLALLSRVTEHVQTRLLIDSKKPSDASPGDALTRTKRQRCSHCHSSGIHEGGTCNCDLKTWKSKIARTLATEIARRAMAGDELLNVALAEVPERESNNKGWKCSSSIDVAMFLCCHATLRTRRLHHCSTQLFMEIDHTNKIEIDDLDKISGCCARVLSSHVCAVETCGSAGLGADPTRVAWPLLEQVFNCDSGVVSVSLPLRPDSAGAELGCPQRLPESAA